MPAVPSSLTEATVVAAVGQASPGLLQRLAEVPDPRSVRGRRHPLVAVLALVVCASAAVGNDSLAAIGEWVAEASQPVLARLRARVEPLTGRRVPPSEATIRRVLADIDAAALDAATCRFLADHARASTPVPPAAPTERETRRVGQDGPGRPPAGLRTALAVDGKTCRGARGGGRRPVHLVSAMRHAQATTVAQCQVPATTSEIDVAAGLLDGLDVTGMVITTDALHTRRATARALVEDHHAHYLMVLKGNQPALLGAAATALATGTDAEHAAAGTGATTHDRGHGRRERRTLRVAPATGIDFPHAAQVMRVHRVSGTIGGPWLHTQVIYAVTSLPADQTGPAQLMAHARGHWHIETKSPYVRDTTFNEDACQVRTRSAPHALAAVRNLVTGAMRLAGHVNIAHARRWYARHPHRTLTLFNITPS